MKNNYLIVICFVFSTILTAQEEVNPVDMKAVLSVIEAQ